MLIDVYGVLGSPPCRSVLLCAKALGVPVNLIEMMPRAPEAQKAEFVRMNPQKTIPTMNDNGLFMSESRAIMRYLCNKYARKDTYYSKVPNERAIIDCRLDFDMGTLYARFAEAYLAVIFGGQSFDQEKLKRLDQALEFVDAYIEQGYIAGSQLTIADFSVAVSLSSIQAVGHDLDKFPRVKEYMARCKKEIPGYDEINEKGVESFRQFVGPALEKARSA